MKVIFLDVDGVLNSENHAREMEVMAEAGHITKKKYYNTWDLPYDGTALPLKKIVDETGAKIVLSSSWRILYGATERLEKALKPYNISIFDKTCKKVSFKDLERMRFNPRLCHSAYSNDNECYTTDRGAEIALWLDQHPEVESFVILDDDTADIQQYYMKEHVVTNFYNWGLTFDLANKAIEILNKKGDKTMTKKTKKRIRERFPKRKPNKKEK